MLFVAYDNGSVHYWNLTSEGFTNVGHFDFSSPVTCFVYSSKMLVLGLQGGKIAFVMLESNQKQETSVSNSDIIVRFCSFSSLEYARG